MAWGKDIVGGPGEPDGCYYLYPQPKAQSSYRIAFMIEHQRVRAAGCRCSRHRSAGRRPGRHERRRDPQALSRRIAEQPHKYVEGGKYLRHRRRRAAGVLVFETDPAGKVTEWRVGVPPQVDYVEGCG